MSKRITSLFLALIMLLQILIPQNIFAEEEKSLPQDGYVKVGMIDEKSYDAKIMNELNRIAAENRKPGPNNPGIRLFSSGPYFGDNNEPKDEDKPKYFGNVSAKLDLIGLDGNDFQWNEIFGVDESGNPKPAQIIFRQMDVESSTDTGLYYILQITKGGKYTWSDGAGNPTKLPLFSTKLKPYRYEVRIDERVSDKVKLLTSVSFGTEGSSPTFLPENEDGEIIANITLGLTYQQIASTKFKSEWYTNVAEDDRPGMKANFAFDDEGYGDSPVTVELPKNDKDTKIIRDWYNEFDPDLVMSFYLEKTPNVQIDETTAGLTFEEVGGVKTVKSGEHKFKYEFKYDVIDGGKLSMTEIIPVTFDANGGNFASITEPNAEQKIVEEVDYNGTLTDKPEAPKREGMDFAGWSLTKDGPAATDEDFTNIKEKKTFYAIWSKRDIKANELEVGESYTTDNNFNSYTNNLGPSYKTLRDNVKVKDDSGNFVPIPKNAKFRILNENGAEYYEDGKDLREYLYGKVQEKANPNDKPTRTETVKAKVIYANGTSQTVDIPIKVYKNIYEAKTEEGKPNYVPEEYVKVTVDPTTKAEKPQKYFYYVNPEANVLIPGKDPTGTGDYKFIKWTMKEDDAAKDAEGKKYTFGYRNVFTKATTITAQYSKDIVPQESETKPKEVPDNFVLVEFKKGTNGELEGTTKYWVNPKAGKKLSDITHPTVTADEEWKHTGWDKDATTAITETPNPLEVTAQYLKKVLTEEPTKNKEEYVKVEFTQGAHGTIADTETKAYWVLKDVEVTLTAPQVKANDNYQQKEGTDAWSPKVQKSYSADATHVAQYTYIGTDVVPAKDDGSKPDNTPDDFIKVIVKLTDKAKVVGPSNEELTGEDYTKAITKTFWVAPNKEVTIPVAKPEGKDVPVDESNPKAYKWNFTKWTSDEVPFRTWTDGITAKFTNEITTITAQYDQSITDQGTVVADEITVHESFIDGDTWINNFIDTEATEAILKGALKVNGGDLPSEAKVEFLDKEGNVKAYADLATELYDKLQEKDDGNKSSRKETIKAKVTFKNGEVQTVDIPIKVIKNIYEAKTEEGKPNYVPEGYVKVTVDPTTKAEKPQKYFYYVNPNAQVVIPGSDPTGTGDNTFTKWLIDGTDTEYKLEEKPRHQFDSATTIKAQYESDVIPQDGPNKPDTVPSNFVEVKFVPTDKATDETEKIYWVNPEKAVTIPVANPVGKQYFTFKEWKLGADAKGDKYTPSTPKKFEEATTITATYTESDNIIPFDPTNLDDPKVVRPEGYVKITFEAEKGLKLTESKAYYVKANANITLKDIKDDAAKGYPAYEVQTGYKFDKWDKEDSLVIESTDIVVKAKATPLDDVVPKIKDDGTENEQPDGYITVTFKTTDKAGSIEKVVYINPNKAVALEGQAPEVNPITGYEFADWDRPVKEKIQYEDNDVITAQFNEIGNVVPGDKPQPAGYVKVIFDKGEHGELSGTTSYWVKPEVEVTVEAPSVKANTGFKFTKWDKETTLTAKKTDTEIKITAEYEKLDDIIPSKKDDGTPNVKPEGYVTVTFDKGDHGTLSGQNVYYVNPESGKTIGNLTKPKVTPETGWNQKADPDAWDKADTTPIKGSEDITVIAQYDSIPDVVPKTKDDESDKPEGYITVTFDKGAHGTLSGQTAYYVNPNKAVILEDKAPTVKPNTGYTSAGWDASINKAIQYEDGDKITALYNELGDVIPQKNTDGTDKPVGYVTVTFVEGEHGTLSGKTVYYVNPNKKVTVPAPTVTPATGYKFDKWDKELTQTFAEDTTITAGYKALENIIPKTKDNDSEKPNGYHTVTFKAVNGTLSGTTTYYVKPNVDIDLTNTAAAITKRPYIGFTAEGVNWEPTISEQKYTKDETYTFTFKPVPDVVEVVDGKSRPEGYVRVDVIPTYFAKDPTIKSYWVNPTTEVTIPAKAIIQPLNDNFKFLGWDQPLTQQFRYHTNIVAKFERVSKPTPPTPGGPGGYYPGGSGFIIGKTTEKIVKVPDNSYLKEVWYMQGFNGDFRPKDGLTRAEAAQILANALVEDGYRYNPNFKLPYRDIGEEWYTKAIKIVTEARVFEGYDDGNFKPQWKITRNEWIATLKRFQELSDVTGNHMNLNKGHWATAEIEAAYNAGWLKIYTDGVATYEGDKFIPRQEVAAVSNKAFNRVLDKTYIRKNDRNLVTYRDVSKDMWAYDDILCASNTFLAKRDMYYAQWVDRDNNMFNIYTKGFDIVQAKFQRIPR